MCRRLLLGLLLPVLASCAVAERGSPALHISPDLRSVAFFAPTSFAGDPRRVVEILDRGMGTSVLYRLPDSRSGERLVFLDDHLYVSSYASSAAHREATGFVLDEGRWAKAPYLDCVWYPPFAGRYDGRPVVFRPGYETEVYSLHDFARVSKLDFPVRGVGDGYMLRYQWPPGLPMVLTSQGWLREVLSRPDGSRTLKRVGISGMDLLDPDLKPVLHLDAAKDASGVRFSDEEAQISPDHKALMLAPRHHGGIAFTAMDQDTIISSWYDGFAVYEVPSGKLLYSSAAIFGPAHSGRPDPREMRGAPVTPVTLTDDGVYALEETIPPDPAATNPAAPHRQPNVQDHQFWLTRYTAAGRQHLLRLPLAAEGPFFRRFSTAASPAGRFMVIHTAPPAPRLIEVPLRPDVTEKDLRYFNLPESAP